MGERLHFLVMYVGSAAMTAFLAACLSSPRVATFTCDSSSANGAGHCELLETLAATPADDPDAARDPQPAQTRGEQIATSLLP